MKNIFAVWFVLFVTVCNCQNACEPGFARDTMSLPEGGKTLDGEYLETTLKNGSMVRLFKTDDNHYYLRMYVTKNFYFDKVGDLEIRSGTKSYYARQTKQHKIDKHTGMFIIEIMKNYISTLKDGGITSIVFSDSETDFTKQDTKQIKVISQCFYDAISVKTVKQK
jgi:hypothetical protein